MANEKFKINGVVSEVVPIVGTTGDILKKTASGVEWGELAKATQTQDGLLSKEDFNKLVDIEAGAQVNAVTSVNGQTGAVVTPNTTYTAGVNISISESNEISAKDTTYTAGTNVSISNNKISVTDVVTSVNGQTGEVTINEITSAERTKLSNVPSDNVKRSVILTQAAYDALSTAEKGRADTVYFTNG